jgi:hypothetical protein
MSVFMFKSILTTLVLLVAIVQTITGLRTRGYLRRIPLPARTLRLWHRVGGDFTLALTTLVGIICVASFNVALHPERIPAHAWLGVLSGLSMIAKVVMARRYRRYLRQALRIGALAGFSVLGTFGLSALSYFLVEF